MMRPSVFCLERIDTNAYDVLSGIIGTNDPLCLMRDLRRLRDELEISILVVTDCLYAQRGKSLAEADLGRTRVLCSVADIVFAISRHRTHLRK
jgi:hypothetical protein